MTTFDDREKGFERKFIHDQELAFKALARRNKLLGLWAAAKLGKTGPDAEQFAKDFVLSDFGKGGTPEDVAGKLFQAFKAAGLPTNLHDIQLEMEKLLPIAQKQILGDSKV